MSTEVNRMSASVVPPAFDAGRPAVPAAATARPDVDTQLAQAAEPWDLGSAVDELAAHAAESGAELDFRIDRDLHRVIVTVTDRRDGTVLRQMPSEEALRIARHLARYQPHLIEIQA